MSPNGFSLVELLVVVAVVAILIGIALPTMSSANARARSVACEANLKGFAPAIQQFRYDNRNQLPYADGPASFGHQQIRPWDQLAQYMSVPLPRVHEAPPQIETGPPFVCPADRNDAAAHGTSYWYMPWVAMSVIGQAQTTIGIDSAPGEYDLFRDGDEYHRKADGFRGMNALFADYSVRRLPRQ